MLDAEAKVSAISPGVFCVYTRPIFRNYIFYFLEPATASSSRSDLMILKVFSNLNDSVSDGAWGNQGAPALPVDTRADAPTASAGLCLREFLMENRKVAQTR